MGSWALDYLAIELCTENGRPLSLSLSPSEGDRVPFRAGEESRGPKHEPSVRRTLSLPCAHDAGRGWPQAVRGKNLGRLGNWPGFRSPFIAAFSAAPDRKCQTRLRAAEQLVSAWDHKCQTPWRRLWSEIGDSRLWRRAGRWGDGGSEDGRATVRPNERKKMESAVKSRLESVRFEEVRTS
jgi:hypothetical protein